MGIYSSTLSNIFLYSIFLLFRVRVRVRVRSGSVVAVHPSFCILRLRKGRTKAVISYVVIDVRYVLMSCCECT